MRRWLARCPRKSTELRRTWPPFTDWQNDLHLISGFVYRKFVRHFPDLATLITAAIRSFPDVVSIGSREDRSGYDCHRVPH